MLAIQLIRIRGLDLGYVGLQDTGNRKQETGNRDTGYRIQDIGYMKQDTGYSDIE